MNSACQIKLDVLLDCTQVETDEGTKCVFQTTDENNDITRIQFLRLMGINMGSLVNKCFITIAVNVLMCCWKGS